jgi:hypothetical protein
MLTRPTFGVNPNGERYLELDHWGGELDQVSLWVMGGGREGGVALMIIIQRTFRHFAPKISKIIGSPPKSVSGQSLVSDLRPQRAA